MRTRVLVLPLAALLLFRAEPVHAQAAQAVPHTSEPSDAPAPQAPPKVEPPHLKTDATADYPERALTDKYFQTSTVNLTLEIDLAGHVKKATVDSPQGHGFDEAATLAAAKLVFEPATRNGTPVAALVKWRFIFAPPPPRLKGRVARRSSDTPIAGAPVLVRPANGSNRETTTLADGTWKVDDLPPGVIHVEVTFNGLSTESFDETLAPGEETNLVLRLAPPGEAAGKTAPTPGEEEVTVKGERPPPRGDEAHAHARRDRPHPGHKR